MQVRLRIQRFTPEKDSAPHFEDYAVGCDPTDRVLDAILAVKGAMDGSLTIRKSCGHGICGSDGVRINGRNALACRELIRNHKQPIVIEPMKGFKIIKDLVVDMEPFFQKYRSVKPYLVNDDAAPEKERLQSEKDRMKFEDTTKCILCACCTTSCPTYWADSDFLGPAALVAAHRFIFDSRDQATDARLDIAGEKEAAWKCRTIFNCTDACPRGIEITQAIGEIKRKEFFRKF